jgi:seryl-tRNA synthetase
MHDIRAIREAPEAFDAALARRGLAPQSSDILSLDEARRACIQAAEAALAERNAASKDVGRAKARATRRNSSASARWWPKRRTRSPRWRRKPRKRTPPARPALRHPEPAL